MIKKIRGAQTVIKKIRMRKKNKESDTKKIRGAQTVIKQNKNG